MRRAVGPAHLRRPTRPWIGLAICLFTDLLRNRLSGQPIVVVDPRPHDRVVLFEYYDMFFPLACLAAAIAQDG